MLADDGLFVVHLCSPRPWIGPRLYWSLADAFGREPALFDTPRSPFESVAFVLGPESITGPGAPTPPGVARILPDSIRAVRNETILATDDWPHLYLESRTLPVVYIAVLALVLVISVGAFRAAGRFELRRHLELFLLGAGFMLLETRSLTSMALSFGSTWVVSAIVIGSILAVVFLGNLLVLRGLRLPPALGYGLIALLLLLQYALPLRYVAQGGFGLRLLLALAWVGAPVRRQPAVLAGVRRVADEPLDGAALGLDLCSHRGEVGLEHVAELLGVELLTERGRAREIANGLPTAGRGLSASPPPSPGSGS